MKKEKILTKIICFTMICSTMFSIQPVHAEAAGNYVEEPSEDELVSLADFEAVDDLIEQRVDALREGDMDKYRELTEELKEHGCEDVSAKEVQQLTGMTPNNLLNSQSQSRLNTFNSGISAYSAASTNVTFSTTYTTITYKNKKYKVMKIVASPTGPGTLNKTGSAAKRYSVPIQAGTLNLLTVIAGYVKPESKIIKAISAYDALKSVFDGFAQTTVIEGISANYTWTVDETCSFIYVYDSRVRNYVIGASYNKARSVVAVNIPYFKVKNGKRYSTILQKKYAQSVSSHNYGSARYAVKYFKLGKTYNSWLNNVAINGCQGQQVHNVYLLHPSTAMQLGYWN